MKQRSKPAQREWLVLGLEKAGPGQESGQGVSGSMQQVKRNRNIKRGETEEQTEVCVFVKICMYVCVCSGAQLREQRGAREGGGKQHKYAHYHSHNNIITNQWGRGHKHITLSINPDR